MEGSVEKKSFDEDVPKRIEENQVAEANVESERDRTKVEFDLTKETTKRRSSIENNTQQMVQSINKDAVDKSSKKSFDTIDSKTESTTESAINSKEEIGM